MNPNQLPKVVPIAGGMSLIYWKIEIVGHFEGGPIFLIQEWESKKRTKKKSGKKIIGMESQGEGQNDNITI
jgi:hypothetical protein